jgi:hypothetical protein
MLKSNVSNRKIDSRRLKVYARDMRAGRWLQNGEPIIFSDSRLLSGQHRLEALILANVTLDFLVVRGVSQDAFLTLDSGKPRYLCDLLDTRGLKNTKVVAAAIMALLKLRSGNFWKDGWEQPCMLLDQVEPELFQLAEAVSLLVGKKKLKMLAPLGWVAAMLHMATSQGCHREFLIFLDGLETGVCGEGVLHLLRERLVANLASKARIKKEILVSLIIKGWNAHYLGLPLKVLKFVEGEAWPELDFSRDEKGGES